MVVAPGFSVNDLLVAARTCKDIADAFIDEHANSAAVLKNLSADIETYAYCLEEYKAILEKVGESYRDYDSFQRTLNEFREFISKYNVVLDKKRADPSTWLKTAQFALETKRLTRLQSLITTQVQKLMLSSQIRLVSNSFSGGSGRDVRTASELALARIHDPNPAIQATALDTGEGGVYPVALTVTRTWSNASSLPVSPTIAPGLPLPQSRPLPTAGSPALRVFCNVMMPRPRRSKPLVFGIPVVPEIELRDRGWDIVAYVKKKNSAIPSEIFRHTIPQPYETSNHPFTWHKRLAKYPGKWLEVELRASVHDDGNHESSYFARGERHSLTGAPTYLFNSNAYFKVFQSKVHGKLLKEIFDVEEILCDRMFSTGTIATAQHLKIWEDWESTDPIAPPTSYLAFFANRNGQHTRHLEIPLFWFDPDWKEQGKSVKMNFSKAILSLRRSSTASVNLGSNLRRAATFDSSSLPGSDATSLSSRRSSGATGFATLTDLSNLSIRSSRSQSYDSDESTQQVELLSRAQEMKYLKFVFEKEADAQDFVAKLQELSTTKSRSSSVSSLQSYTFGKRNSSTSTSESDIGSPARTHSRSLSNASNESIASSAAISRRFIAPSARPLPERLG